MKMRICTKTVVAVLALLAMSSTLAQTTLIEPAPVADESEMLKIAALEALIAAPPERALPIVAKVLNSNNSNEVKSRALFVLSQIDLPEAHAQLLDFAKTGDAELRRDAVRMIGISGDDEALAGLADLYNSGNEDVRDAVLEAYLIAGDKAAVLQIAENAKDAKEFEAAVEMLGVMGAHDELRALRESSGFSEALIEAFAISGDFEALRELALDTSDPGIQAHAIEALGIVGGEDVNATLLEVYRGTDSADVREAALEGMLISGYDEGVLELYKASDDISEKRQLLEMMTVMGSDLVLDLIDEALGGDL
jgi:HEAT repeat protein